MSLDEQKASEIINKVALDGRFPKKIANIMHRPDAQDYVVMLDDESICLIREKLINLVHEHNLGDAKREILGKLKTAEHVDISAPAAEEEEKISVEDDEKV